MDNLFCEYYKSVNSVVSRIIKFNVTDLLPKKKILRNWIPENKLYWKNLSYNKNAIDLLKKNQYKIHWKVICLNPNAIELIEDKIQEESYFKKFSVIKLITNLLFDSSLDWVEYYLTEDKSAIHQIKNYILQFNSGYISYNFNIAFSFILASIIISISVSYLLGISNKYFGISII